jgi:hypothetical protein
MFVVSLKLFVVLWLSFIPLPSLTWAARLEVSSAFMSPKTRP